MLYGYWEELDKIVNENEIVIDRKKNTAHPKYKNMIYPVDYGYIKNTKSMDKNEIDIFCGSDSIKRINGILCTIDIMKNDSEIKVLYGCTDNEIELLCGFLESEYMSCIFVKKNT